ncbi:MAG TPA: hypothetical protein PLC42_07750, partial [Parachlamydiaceae bacterium]|nr:hypothetical protein [Parachlamydiaceae bacterium]
KWSSVIRVVHEIFLSYCNFLEKKARLTYDLGGMDITTRNTAIQIRSSSLQNSRQNFFCESIEKIAHLSFLLFPSQNTKEIALATSALNAIRIIFQKWNSQKPLQTAGHCLIAAIKSYSVYSLFPKQSVSPNNYCPKEKHYFLEALAEEDPVKNLKEPDSLVPFEAEWQNDENASIPNDLKKNFIQYSEVELLELKILFGEVPFHQNEFS